MTKNKEIFKAILFILSATPITALTAPLVEYGKSGPSSTCMKEIHENKQGLIRFIANDQDLNRQSIKEFGEKSLNPHIFETSKAENPVEEKALKNRTAYIETDEFFRKKEGVKNEGEWVRYFSVKTEDCQEYFLRIEEESDIFKEYWHDRGDILLGNHEFFERYGHSLGFQMKSVIEKLEELKERDVFTHKIATNKSWEGVSNQGIVNIDEFIGRRARIHDIKNQPFEINSQYTAPYSMVLQIEGMREAIKAPANPHAMKPWQSWNKKSHLEGNRVEKAYQVWGEPDKVHKNRVMTNQKSSETYVEGVMVSAVNEVREWGAGSKKEMIQDGFVPNLIYKDINGDKITVIGNRGGMIEEVRVD